MTTTPDKIKTAKGGSSPLSTCSADFVMPFGKYRGKSLDQIADSDGQYVLWLASEGVLKIERCFLEAVEMDEREAESELRDIINEHCHDIY